MDRRRTLTVAGAVLGTLASGGLAVAANLGILGFSDGPPGDIGKLDLQRVEPAASAGTGSTTTGPPATIEPPAPTTASTSAVPVVGTGASTASTRAAATTRATTATTRWTTPTTYDDHGGSSSSGKGSGSSGRSGRGGGDD